MLVDTINKVKDISFDSSNLNAYVESLRDITLPMRGSSN